MSKDDIIIKEALRRRDIFNNLDKHLKMLKDAISKIDSKAEVYLFGSVAEDRYVYASDIDILIISNKHPAEVIARLYAEGFTDPFEFHVESKDKLARYERYSRLLKV